MRKALVAGVVASVLGAAGAVAGAPEARADVTVPQPSSTANAVACLRPTCHRPSGHVSVHVSIGVSIPPHHHVITPPEIHGGTISLPNISAGTITLPDVSAGAVVLPGVSAGTIVLPGVHGGTVTLPNASAGGIVIPRVVLPTPTIQARANFLAAGGAGRVATTPSALPRTGA